ncbi:MAG TPA: beta-glucosidase [Phycisphaerae bacterium]|nr:beta-glucosidase [Phycisphaerae bacterium]
MTDLQIHPQPAAHEHPRTRTHCGNLFQSFWMGGFESACQINTRGQRIDMLAATQHDLQAYDDYCRARDIGISTFRDGVRWPCVELSPGRYDWSTFIPMIRAAERAGVQIVWNLLHYGWPPDIDILSGEFIDRFAHYCRAAARIVKDETPRPPVYVPVNEISFLSWAIGYKGIVQPLALGRAWEIKQQLVRAAIAGMEAVWSVDPRARFAHVDPIIHVIPPRDRPDLADQAWRQREAQFQSWDMLCGRLCPELGGAIKYLDIVGVNYYHSNQFETPDVRLRWEDHPRDDRFLPFHRLLDEVHQRYARPFFVAETSHFGEGRARWIEEIAQEIYVARMQAIPVGGLCLYPLIDRPDWEDFSHWHNSGLWDLRPSPDGRLERVACQPYLDALRASQTLLREIGCS